MTEQVQLDISVQNNVFNSSLTYKTIFLLIFVTILFHFSFQWNEIFVLIKRPPITYDPSCQRSFFNSLHFPTRNLWEGKVLANKPISFDVLQVLIITIIFPILIILINIIVVNFTSEFLLTDGFNTSLKRRRKDEHRPG